MNDKNEVVLHEQSEYNVIYEQTVSDMEALGTYKPEFIPIIMRYAEMRLQYALLMDQWYSSGCVITEPYTNKAGATNQRKTPVYQSIEQLRQELVTVENLLGITPAGYKKINNKGLAKKKGSVLAEALKKLE